MASSSTQATQHADQPSENAPVPLIGELHGNTRRLADQGQKPKPLKTQPGPLWKALAYFYKDYLARGVADLSDEQQVIFIAGPDQLAVPGGQIVPDDVQNYQTFAKADAIQTPGRLSYSLEGPSYFEQLSLQIHEIRGAGELDTFRMVYTQLTYQDGQNSSPELKARRAALLQAKQSKDEAWDAARIRYIAQRPRQGDDPNSSGTDSAFAAYLRQDEDYTKAWEIELICEQAYTDLLSPAMQAIKGRLDTLKFADDRLDYRVGNNMSCTALSEDFLRGQNSVSPNDRYYRPHYALTNYDSLCDSWGTMAAQIDAKVHADANAVDYEQHQISLQNAAKRPWAALGHPELDFAKQMPLTSADKALLRSVKVYISFWIEPRSVDVERGLWNVPYPRKFARLADDAPESLKEPFCKTTKLLVAWNIDMTFELPATIGTLAAKDVDFTPLGVQPVPVNDEHTLWRWKSERLAYPVLLAVLASVA